jgi:hypothetical protein
MRAGELRKTVGDFGDVSNESAASHGSETEVLPPREGLGRWRRAMAVRAVREEPGDTLISRRQDMPW